jgi:ribonuclease D
MMKISPEEIQQFPLIRFSGKIHLVRSHHDWLAMMDKFQDITMVGIDTEKKPSFRKGEIYPVSVLQLATEDEAYIVQLKYLSSARKSMESFFESDRWQKIGLALHDDIKDLQKLFPFQPKGFINLDQLAKQRGFPQTGLRSLVAILLQSRLSKACQKSNWAQDPLSQEQLIYAATDAWVCLKLFPHFQ